MEDINGSMDVAKLFREVMKLFRQSMDKLVDDLGFTAPQCMVIGVLGQYGEMKISEISKRISLSNSTVSGIVDRLENQGVLIRRRSEKDKRVVYVSISESFNICHANLYERLVKSTELIMNRGNAEELNKIYEGLNILKKLLTYEIK